MLKALATRAAQSLRKSWKQHLTTLALAWVAAWSLGRIQEYAPHASLWFPPAGLTFAALAVLGPRAVPGVTAAAVPPSDANSLAEREARYEKFVWDNLPRNMVANLSTFWSLSSASTHMLKAINHSATRMLRAVPSTAMPAAIAIVAVMAKSAMIGR